MPQIPDKIIPLIYLVAVAGIGGGLHALGVPPEMTGMIVGAGLTRVKVGAPDAKAQKPPAAPPQLNVGEGGK